jgi:hypothetical protein
MALSGKPYNIHVQWPDPKPVEERAREKSETRSSARKPLHTVTNNGEDQLASNYFAILEGIWATTQVSAQPLHRAMTYEIRKKLKRSIVTKRILRKV